jgi:hypothetical protein
MRTYTYYADNVANAKKKYWTPDYLSRKVS